MTEQEKYWVWLASIEGMGAVTFYKILNVFLDAETACRNHADISKRLKLPEALARNIRKSASRAYWDGLFVRIEKGKIGIVTRLASEYPQTLAEIENPPPVLYVKGQLPDFSMSCAMVGSRKPTKGGFSTAESLARELAAQGVTIVSGMARGVDTASHAGALAAGGKTVAVLGCGVDVVYPEENKPLYDEIVEKGAVISEFVPGLWPVAKNFPIRNRIIAGISQVLVAGEGGEKSGARITVDYALKQGRDVYAMACDLKSPMAKLPIYLMEAGAPVVKHARDLMADHGWAMRFAAPPDETGEGPSIDADEGRVYNLLLREPLSADEIGVETGIDMKELNMLLTVMELNGLIEPSPGGKFEVKG